MSDYYDTIVVGGGTAGCIVAARISEDPDRRVVMLEAGPDYWPNDVPGPLASTKYVPMRSHSPEPDPQHDWGLEIEGGGGGRIAVPQGRVVGGGSAINGGYSLRGIPADYDEWAALGNSSWSWDSVFPLFRELENDTAGTPDIHGRTGPWPIARAAEPEYNTLQAAFVNACRSLGYADCYDMNSPDADGVGPLPIARVANRRVSTAETHLNPVRWRKNLTVKASVDVDRVLFEDGRASGVVLADGTTIGGGEVILCAGAIQDPAILQRSGVGPKDLLESHGIPVVLDLPVGEHLSDHWAVPLLAVPAEDAWSPDHHAHQTVARTSSSPFPGSADLQYTMYSYVNNRSAGGEANMRGLAGLTVDGVEHVVGVGCILQKPRATGWVRITSTNPADLPEVDPDYLANEDDKIVARECVRRGWDIITTEPLAGLLGTIIGIDAETVADDAKLDEAIESLTASGYHFAGSVRMAPQDKGGVVDEMGRVYGCENLRVADASVMPTIPSANTMLPTIMVAERLGRAARDGKLT